MQRVGEHGPLCTDCPPIKWSSVGVVPCPHQYVAINQVGTAFPTVSIILSLSDTVKQAVEDIAPQRAPVLDQTVEIIAPIIAETSLFPMVYRLLGAMGSLSVLYRLRTRPG